MNLLMIRNFKGNTNSTIRNKKQIWSTKKKHSLHFQIQVNMDLSFLENGPVKYSL